MDSGENKNHYNVCNKGDILKQIEEETEEKEKVASTPSSSMNRSSSRPQLDLSRAAIQGDLEDRNPTILLPNQSDDISHLALDIGGFFSHLPCSFLIFYVIVIGGFFPYAAKKIFIFL